jgi:hypothetical protein
MLLSSNDLVKISDFGLAARPGMLLIRTIFYVMAI